MQFPHVEKLTQHSIRIPFLAARSFFGLLQWKKKVHGLHTHTYKVCPKSLIARSRIWLVLFVVEGNILLIPSDTFIRRCLFRTHQHPIILVPHLHPYPAVHTTPRVKPFTGLHVFLVHRTALIICPKP